MTAIFPILATGCPTPVHCSVDPHPLEFCADVHSDQGLDVNDWVCVETQCGIATVSVHGCVSLEDVQREDIGPDDSCVIEWPELAGESGSMDGWSTDSAGISGVEGSTTTESPTSSDYPSSQGEEELTANSLSDSSDEETTGPGDDDSDGESDADGAETGSDESDASTEDATSDDGDSGSESTDDGGTGTTTTDTADSATTDQTTDATGPDDSDTASSDTTWF